MERVSISQTCSSLARIALPEDANPGGTFHGGKYLTIIDESAYCAAMTFCRSHVVTARYEGTLAKRVRIGERVITESMVIAAGRTSMLTRVLLFAEDMRAGTRRECARCYFLCVAVDGETYAPVPVPELYAETPEEEKLLALGQRIMEKFKAERDDL